jgi:alkylhydroperoxidase family enzyme
MAADLPLAMKALLGFALKLNLSPSRVSRADFDALRTCWYSDQRITEAVVIVGLA